MPWAIVKQPDGYYARFSTIVDHFTHYNMTREEAIDCAADYIGRLYAEAAVQRAETEAASWEEWSWEDCLQTVKDIHGKDELTKFLKNLP